MEHADFDRLFEPRSIAVIGVSDNTTKGAAGFLNSLIKLGFPGEIYPVHPKQEEIQGVKTYRSVSDIPDPVDHAIIGVPAAAVPAVIEDCVNKGVPSAQIFTAGFAEEATPEGIDLQRTVVEKAKGKIRVIGPNCMGIYHPRARVGFWPEQPVEHGDVSFILQSGWLADNLVDVGASQSIAVNKLVSIGNACDLNANDFLKYFSKDPSTGVVGVYLEGLREGESREFFNLAKAMTMEKPLVLWKSGFTEAGARAAKSHTGSMVGSYDMWRSISSQAGIMLVQNTEEMIDVISLYKRAPLPQGKNVGIVACGGGTSVTATDACTVQGLTLPVLSDDIQEKINEYIPDAGTFTCNPVDVTGWVTSPRISRGASSLVINAPNIDALIFILDTHFIFKLCGRLNLDTERIIKGHAKHLLKIKEETEKPLVCVLLKSGDAEHLEKDRLKLKEALNEQGLANFLSTDRAAKALSRLIEYSAYLRNAGVGTS
ncbi:acetate--CoA ligase family protein [Thermodesulfobacteriota bacterium]